MARINILDSSIYNLIAAGEVVERPASVIKELVENSIDAKATIITIEINGGGIDSMIVTDNGCGIEKDDLKTAFLPHATSKISCSEDLDCILTLGFRGEALASIAAISKVTMASRIKSCEVGGIIEIDGGKFISIGQIGMPVGTTVKVEKFFYNVPARAKFLKKAKSEEQEITNLVSRFILANPNISFRYLVDGNLIFQSTGSGLEDALYCVYGKDALTETLKITRKFEEVEIFGVIGKGSFTKPNRTYQTLIVNGRNVVNQQVSFAVTNAYGEMLMKRQYPFYVIYVNIPAQTVDVNVHPNKLEVRFEKPNKIMSLIYETCKVVLANNREIRSVMHDTSVQNENGVVKFPASSLYQKGSKIDYAGVDLKKNINNLENGQKLENLPTNETSQKNSKTQELDSPKTQEDNNQLELIETISVNQDPVNVGVADGFGVGSSLLEQFMGNGEKELTIEEKELPKSPLYEQQPQMQQTIEITTEIKSVGKIFNTYLIIQDEDNVYFIDQHAAHERVLYERFKEEIESGELAIQPMLAPYILKINPQEKQLIDDNIDNLHKLGFDIEEFGLNTYKISSIPVIVSEINFDKFFSIFLQETKRNTAVKTVDLIKDEIMQLSCKSAVKAGYDLTKSEIEKIYQAIIKDKIALYCPHGRPIIVKITKQEVEKWFKRIV